MAKHGAIAIDPKRFDRSQVKFYIALLPVLFVVALPIVYIVSTAFKPVEELFAYPPRFLAIRPTFDNFAYLFDISGNSVFPITLYLFNSVAATLLVILAGTLISAAAAFSLSKLRFKGRTLVMRANTLSMMFVAAAVSIPRYLIVKHTGLIDTFTVNIITLLAAPVAVFLLKQFIDQVPDALIESAKIDGAGNYRILFGIVIPVIKPAMATVCIVLFQNVWNNVETSNLFINRETLKTFAFYMNSLAAAENGVATVGMAAAAALIMFVPNVVLFVCLQSRVMNTMTHSGLK